MANPAWKGVSPETPCEICGKPDWCSRADDEAAAICRRVQRDGGVACEDKNGAPYYLYQKPGGARVVPPPPDEDRVPRADPAMLDRAYTALGRCLGLAPEHRALVSDNYIASTVTT